MTAHARSRGDIAKPRPFAARRLDAVRHLLKPHQVRESLALAPQPSLRNAALAGLQSALTAAIALPLAYLSPRPHLVGFAALGALVALFGRFAPQGERRRIVLMCALWQSFAVLAMSTAAWLGVPPAAQLMLLALGCGAFFVIASAGQFGPPGALIFVFAAGAAMGSLDSWREVAERTAATASVAALAWAICAATESFRQLASPEVPFPAEPRRPRAHYLIAAARITLGSAAAAFAAHAAGAPHPYWAAMGATAVMQGAHLHISMNRALQRIIGTVIGAGAVWLVLTHTPPVWVVIALLTVLQFGTEMLIGVDFR